LRIAGRLASFPPGGAVVDHPEAWMVDRMFLFRRSWAVLLIFSALSGSAVHGTELFKLADLSSSQRAELYEQVDGFGFLEAVLNYCKRPPKMAERITAIARDCVDDASLRAVVKRYKEAIAKNAGAYHCEDKAFQKEVPVFEEKIENIVSGLKLACRVRSFAGISFSRAN
jgi:hypothetical protein